MPKISVIMPVYNGEKYLRDAIESILNQTYKNFEFIIINDGSTDRSEEIIRSYKDERIVYINNGQNLGLSKSFNVGVKNAKEKYLARMDADDISELDRFQKQFTYLENNKNVGVVGSYATFIDKNNVPRHIIKKPKDHILIKWQSFFSNPLIHPSVMGRTEIFKNNPYNESLYNSEDFELWSRLIFEKNTILANIPKPLLRYRVHPTSFTQKLDQKRKLASLENRKKNISRYIKIDDIKKISFITYIRLANSFFTTEKIGIKNKIPIYYGLLKILGNYAG